MRPRGVGFMRGRLVHWAAPWVPSGSSGDAGFTGVRLGGYRVHPGSLGSLRCALDAVGFIRGRWFHREAPWGLSGSSGFARFTGRRLGVRRVHPGSLSSFGCALGAVGFIRVRWVHYGAPWGRRIPPGSLDSMGCSLGVVGFFRGRWVQWGAPWVSSGSYGFAAGVRLRCRWGHPGSLGSIGYALAVFMFIQGHWVHWGAPCVPSGSSVVAGFNGVRPGVRRVLSGLLGSLGCALGSLSSLGCAHGCRRVHPGSLDSLVCVVGFIRSRWVHWDAPWGRRVHFSAPRVLSVSSGVAVFPTVRPGGHRVHSGSLCSLGCALGAVECIRCNWVHSGAPMGPSGSS